MTVKTIPTTKFREQGPKLVEQLGKTYSVIILTKHGEPVADIVPHKKTKKKKKEKLFGRMEGTAKVQEGYDLTQPIDVEWDAQKGILYNS